jgi:multidrug/hemolysin transport system permease protein
MTQFSALFKRNTKLFFKDKDLFFTSLITPLILLVLYSVFLGKVYKDSFLMAVPEGITIEDSLMNGLVGGQLLSSLLAVCCVTVAFCSNLLMVQDKSSGAYKDLTISPVKSGALSLAYYLSCAFSTFVVCFVALVAGLFYLYVTGWYMTLSHILVLVGDVVIMVLFGTSLSSVVICKLTTQGQASAVGSIVSSVYGFICGAYMPISTFSKGLQKVLSFFPGTYGTAILRTHATNGVFSEMQNTGMPEEAVTQMKGLLDCEPSFFGTVVSPTAMYLILAGSVALLVTATVLLYSCKKKSK